jgi:signal transduction histidine kinase
MMSIRRTLTLWLLGTLAIVLAAGGVGLFAAARKALTRQFDQTLMARASALVAATRWDGAKVDVDFDTEVMPWYRSGAGSECFELRRTNDERGPGEVVMRSPSLGGAAWSVPLGPDLDGEFVDVPLANGRAGRATVVYFKPPPDEDVDQRLTEAERQNIAATAPRLVLVAAKSRGELDRTIRTLLTALGAAGLAVAVAAAIAVRLAVTRGLRPLDRLSAVVRAIDAESLSRRFDCDSVPVELRAVCDRFNGLLERLEAAFARERRFTAAAAHELRTPIAELRSLLEVGLSRPRSADESRRSLDEALAITLHMDRLVGLLLSLARQEAGLALGLGPVDVCDLLRRLRDRHAPDARAGAGDILVEAPPHAFVNADAATLESVLENLLTNAVEYSAPRPDVSCAVRTDDGLVIVEVTNPIAETDAVDGEQFFEPFWRRSASRSDRAHLGLGLALARQFSQSMDGALTAEIIDRTTVRVRLQLRPAVIVATRPAASGEERPELAAT